jgi:hypothetical protein
MEKTIKISQNAHKILKEFCKQNSLKMNPLVEKLILEYVEKKTK